MAATSARGRSRHHTAQWRGRHTRRCPPCRPARRASRPGSCLCRRHSQGAGGGGNRPQGPPSAASCGGRLLQLRLLCSAKCLQAGLAIVLLFLSPEYPPSPLCPAGQGPGGQQPDVRRAGPAGSGRLEAGRPAVQGDSRGVQLAGCTGPCPAAAGKLASC